MHSRLLNMLHHAADEHFAAVADRVDVDLGRVVEKAVEQHRRIVGDFDRLAHVTLEFALLVHDFHRAAAEHVRRAHHQRITDLGGGKQRLLRAARSTIGRLLELEPGQQLLETLAVFGDVDGVRRGADDRHAVGLEVARKLQRRLAAELHDHAFGLLDGNDLQHILQRQRLEIQPVGSVVIGGHGFRIAVDHDGLEAVLAQRQRGMDAAVVKLDALADAVGPATQHHDLAPVRGLCLAFLFIGRVHVGGAGREFRSTGVDALVGRAHAQFMAQSAHRVLVGDQQLRQAAVGKAGALQGAQGVGIEVFQSASDQRLFLAHDVLDLREEPGIDVRETVHLLNGHADAKGISDVENALRTRIAELVFNDVRIGGFLVEAVDAGFQPAQRLLHRFLDGAADRHHLTHRLHLRGQAVVGLRKLLERKPRNLGHHVVDARLEGHRGHAAGDFVAQFVERVTDGEFGRDLGDRETRGLGRQRRGTRHARVHLDDDHAPVLRVDAELHVGAAGLDADLAQAGDRSVAQDLVFLVGQRLRRRHGD